MNPSFPVARLSQTAENAAALVAIKLAQAGFRIEKTFDLQVARRTHAECPCPIHGTDRCNCQMVILLIYQLGCAPATLVIQGRGEKSWVSFGHPSQIPNQQKLEISVLAILDPIMDSPRSLARTTG